MGTGRTLVGGAGRKLLLSGALLGTVASIAGVASYATFTDTTSVDQAKAATGTVDISLGASGANNRLDVGALNLAAGDTLDRQVKLTNAGSIDLGSLQLTTTALTSSVLDTDTTSGLKLSIDSCPVAWTESGPPYTYTCSAGAPTTVVASRPVIGSAISLGTLGSSTAGGSDFLRVRLTLPSAADNSFQGKESAIRYTFDAVQRTATAK